MKLPIVVYKKSFIKSSGTNHMVIGVIENDIACKLYAKTYHH
jgi:hypothetical protein